MIRTLLHHWRMNLAVAAGVAVATAVLAGALVVGDSVRGSLRHLTLERLGNIDQALAGQRFFRRSLVEDLATQPEFTRSWKAAAPAIFLNGSAQHAKTRARATGVNLTGVAGDFLSFFDAGELAEPLATTQGPFPAAVINQALAKALGATEGEDLLLSLKRWSEVPRSSLLGRKDTGSVVETVRLRIRAIVPDRGLGRFDLTAHQKTPFNVFVPLQALAKALGQEGMVNGMVVSQVNFDDSMATTAELNDLLRASLKPEDLGLIIEPRGKVLSVESQEYILKPNVVEVIEGLAQETGATTLPVLTYLVNSLECGHRSVPYSTVTALGDLGDPAFGALHLTDGNPAPRLRRGDILLNSWTAEQLEAEVGDEVTLRYFVVGPREDLQDASTTFRVAGVVALENLAADSSLAQEYPGIAGSDNMADWDPPFPVDLGTIEAQDEEYWDLYRGTPKALIAAQEGRMLWRNRWGDLTALRLAPAPDETLVEFESQFQHNLVERLPLQTFGLAFQPVKELGLGASGGATDFGGLFFGFSMFLIFSAALLVALLFGLGVEQRVGEVGLLRAVGYPEAQVRRQLLKEGLLVAALGGLVGLIGAVLYARAMMYGLRTWWLPAVGTSRLELHITPLALGAGYALSLLVVFFAIWRRVSRLRQVATPQLLKKVAEPVSTRAGKRAGRWALFGLTLAGVLTAIAIALGEADPFLFGGAGAMLLLGLLALFARYLGAARSDDLGQPGFFALLRMASANGARNRGRSLLSATLVACATYMIVTVAAYEQDFSLAELGKDSGTGGFRLVAEADIPLLQDLNTADGLFELGVPDTTIPPGTHITSLRLLPGDDTSCLNLYQPRQPRLLGVPPEMVKRGGFLFQKTSEKVANPWTLLEDELEDGAIPVLGDFNSTQWILKLSLGQNLSMENEAGETIQLRLVGTLKTSLFQSELLISQENLARHFPSLSGWSYFLVETPPEAAEELSQRLEAFLEDYGFDALPAAEKLESFHVVQNTYLSTFRTLGGLGLLLGTVGLAIILLRNTLERRGELAALRAFGFRRSTLTFLVVTENALLLLAGLLMGTVAALLTAAPNLLTYADTVPWGTIGFTLGGIFFFGLAACTVAALGVARIPLVAALKAEN
jgi:ABC-type antimicrobial peptide transport system permease subunit